MYCELYDFINPLDTDILDMSNYSTTYNSVFTTLWRLLVYVAG